MRKGEIIVVITAIVSILIITATSVSAVNYAYNGAQVSYNNGSSGLVATNVQAALDEVYAAANDYATMKAQLVNAIYPVGAVYCSKASTSPNSLFGGGWTQIKDRFILAAGNTYAAGSTGGEATHKLTVDEMPSHRHWVWQNAVAGRGAGNYDGKAYLGQVNVDTNGRYGYTSYEGGDQAHNNMPPYVVYYCWERTS